MLAMNKGSLLLVLTFQILFCLIQAKNMCPKMLVWVNYWQFPSEEMLFNCTKQLIYKTMAGTTFKFKESWDNDMKDSVLNIQNDNLLHFQKIANFTKRGVSKRKIPKKLFEYLKRKVIRNSAVPEPCPPTGHMNCGPDDESGKYAQIFRFHNQIKVRAVVAEYLQPVIENWSEQELEFTELYGVRRYRRGARLALHVDRPSTHVLSAILNIDQKVDQPWLLSILDNTGSVLRIPMEVGDMVLYESAKLPHGRMEPLVGEYYDNLFVHYKPKGWTYDLSEEPIPTYLKNSTST